MTQRAGLGTDNPQSTASLNENVSGTESQTSSPSPPSTARQPIVLPSSQDNLSARDKPLDVVVERATRIVLRRIDVLVNFLTLLPGNQSVVSVIKLGTHRAVILRAYHLFLNSKIGNAHGAMSHSSVTHLSPKPCLIC